MLLIGLHILIVFLSTHPILFYFSLCYSQLLPFLSLAHAYRDLSLLSTKQHDADVFRRRTTPCDVEGFSPERCQRFSPLVLPRPGPDTTLGSNLVLENLPVHPCESLLQLRFDSQTRPAPGMTSLLPDPGRQARGVPLFLVHFTSPPSVLLTYNWCSNKPCTINAYIW